MRLLGVEKACLPQLLPASRDAMKGVYPIVETDFDRISRIAYAEEKAFLRTIASGTSRLEDAVTESKAAGMPLSGADAFALHDTYGFPIDLTLEMAEEAGLKVDEPEFRRLMLEQRQRAQADAKGKKGGGHADLSAFQELLAQGETVFTGYTDLDGESRVRGILSGGQKVGQASTGDEIELVLAETPFYAEAGGQAADTGLITGDGFVVEVLDVQRPSRDSASTRRLSARVRSDPMPSSGQRWTANGGMPPNRRTPERTSSMLPCTRSSDRKQPSAVPTIRPATCASTSPGVKA
jgi:alanyl-tRNA synthetase